MRDPLPSRAPRVILGPNGSVLTLPDLSPPGNTRWVVRRKAEVVAAVEGGLLDVNEACARYRLTLSEFLAWKRAVARHGLRGLQVNRIQTYRGRTSDEPPNNT